MSEKAFYLSELIQKWLEERLSDEERTELEAWIAASEENKSLFNEVTNDNWVLSELEKFGKYDGVKIKDKIIRDSSEHNIPKLRRIFPWAKWAVAASIIITVGLGSYFLFFNHTKQNEIVQTQEERFKSDVEPGKYKAKLTLADGKTIILDSAAVGELVKQGKTVVSNKDGKLVYKANAHGNTEVLYNTLSTNRGESYSVVLADGSKVWLDAASSIRFPTAFTGNERKVEVTGQAYFDVVHNEKMPFKVMVNGTEIKDIGTEFNVNGYNDESNIKVTLVNGSIQIKSKILRPGEQAQVNAGEISLNKNVDLGEITAWKNGVFRFKSADVANVMRQLSRWYDVDIKYKAKIPEGHLTGIVSRNTTLVEVLKMLELNGMEFSVEGKEIIVLR